MKKFLKKTEGFTLVELIVVIAILGILTAIAVPTYSGYVKKANEAGDTQTLSAVNTAIAAAITENNKLMADADDYLVFTATAASEGCKVEVTAKTTTPTEGATATAVAGADAILADFKSYYGYSDIDGIVFKYYKDVTFKADGNLQGHETAQSGD